MTIFKKILSVFLICIMIIPLVCIVSNATMTTSGITQSLNYYKKNIYLENYFWSGGNLDVSYATRPCSCSKAGCMCNCFNNAYQCQGFALYLAYKLTGTYPKLPLYQYVNGASSNGWDCYTKSALGFEGLKRIGLHPGDIVRAAKDPSYSDGHTAMVWKIEKGNVYFVECWGSSYCLIKWGGFNSYSSSLSSICSRYQYVAIWRNSDIIWNGVDSCNHEYMLKAESGHPHQTYYQCINCGDYYYTGETEYVEGCLCCEGIHSFIYSNEEKHPHYQIATCVDCGLIRRTGALGHLDNCDKCKGYPYDFVTECQDNSTKLGSLVHIKCSAKDAQKLYLDMYLNGQLNKTFSNIENGSSVSFRAETPGLYSFRLRADGLSGTINGNISLRVYVNPDIVSVERDDDNIYVKYSDTLSVDDAKAFCKARFGELNSFDASGFTMKYPVSNIKILKNNTDRYEAFYGKFSWEEARDISELLGGQLVKIEDAKQNEVVSAIVGSSSINKSWIGCSDVDVESVWKWVDGKHVTYKNWSSFHSTFDNIDQNWVCISKNGEWCEEDYNGADGFVALFDDSYSWYEEYGLGGVILTGLNGEFSSNSILNIKIPEKIANRKVVGLASGLFDDAINSGASIESIIVSKNVVYIEDGVLDSCDLIQCERDSLASDCLDDIGIGYSIVLPFVDVENARWYTKGVEYCYKNHLMEGTSDTTFEPNTPMTRAMFVCVLGKIEGVDKTLYTGSSFCDVATGKWYSAYVEWAYQNGLAAGNNGCFMFDSPLTREQLAQFMFAFAKYKGEDTSVLANLSGYLDYSLIDGWAFNAVSWAVHRGLISGTDENRISPLDIATRSQVSLIVKNYMESK